MSTSCATVSHTARTELLNNIGTRFIAPVKVHHHSKLNSRVSFLSTFELYYAYHGHLSLSLSVALFVGSKCEMNRRDFGLKGIVATGASVMPSSLVAEPAKG
ncbi:hypothetical protein RHMOL_Rhmol08G0141400 [Rhododendron molle]|uniref:Uncharacterized protein n=1 Tax=Rhododendron molle TaxID=49168 RepID=A0ACC0MN56_RHOML|nr:hypothetical protein RHMOL_Rhmol08G0141400 [Rhododendron molle]